MLGKTKSYYKVVLIMLKKYITRECLARVFALVTGLVLILRIYLSAQEHGSILSGISYLSQFFTILTATIVMMLFFYVGFYKHKGIKFVEPIIIAAIGVGILYHALLAHLWNPTGLIWLADQGVHTVMPLLAFLWWILFRDARVIQWRVALLGIIWPLVYSGYALIRAEFTNFYPYPFLNLENLGWSKLVQNIAMLTLTFFIIGLFLSLISRMSIFKGLTNENA